MIIDTFIGTVNDDAIRILNSKFCKECKLQKLIPFDCHYMLNNWNMKLRCCIRVDLHLCSTEEFLNFLPKHDIVLLYEVEPHPHLIVLDLFSRFIVDVKLSHTLRDASKQDVIVSTINNINQREGVAVVSTIHEIRIHEHESNVSKSASPNDGIALLAATASRFFEGEEHNRERKKAQNSESVVQEQRLFCGKGSSVEFQDPNSNTGQWKTQFCNFSCKKNEVGNNNKKIMERHFSDGVSWKKQLDAYLNKDTVASDDKIKISPVVVASDNKMLI